MRAVAILVVLCLFQHDLLRKELFRVIEQINNRKSLDSAK